MKDPNGWMDGWMDGRMNEVWARSYHLRVSQFQLPAKEDPRDVRQPTANNKD